MSSVYNQLIVVEPIVKPHNRSNDQEDCLILTMYEPKDLDQNDETESFETGTSSEPGIEFLKGMTTEATASLMEPQLLPLIHNLPGATTIYNSYKSVFQNWKNSTPKLVQYPASDLEVVVYRKNGQVDTLRTGASSNGQKYSKLDNGADKVASIDNSQSRILSVGMKQLEHGANSLSSKPKNESNILYQSSSGPPSPPPASPFPPSEFRFIYNQGVYESGKNNGEELQADAAPKSKLIPDLEGIVINLLKTPETPTRASQPSSLVQEVVDNTDNSTRRGENELGATKDTTELHKVVTTQRKDPLLDVGMNSAVSRGKNCCYMVYGPQFRLSSIDDRRRGKTSSAEMLNVPALINESKTESINFEKPTDSSPSSIANLCNENITVEDQSELKTSSTMVQTAYLELVATSTQTISEHSELDNSVKPHYEDFSCQAEMNIVIHKDTFSQCETESAEFSCQVEMKPVVSDSYVQCKTESAEFSCQVEMKPVVSDSYVQCKTESAESSCQVEIPIIGKDASVQCKPPENDSTGIQVNLPGLCCRQHLTKMVEVQAFLKDVEKTMLVEVAKIEKKDKDDELTEEKIYATIDKFENFQRSSKESMNELEKEVDSLKDIVQQSSSSFGLNESSEYFEDVWLPSDGKEEAAVVVPDFD